MLARKWKQRDIIFFLERLEMYIAAGLTINKALRVSMEGMKPRAQTSLQKILKSVEAGSTLSKSAGIYLGLPPTISGLLLQGEFVGELGKAAGDAKRLLEREDDLKRKCISAMTYPIVIGIFALILTIGLVRGIMPQIVPMLTSLHVHLPLLTQIMIAVSNNFLRYGSIGAVIFIVSTFLCVTLYKKWRLFRFIAQSIIVRVPIIGKLLRSYHLSVLLHSMGSLIDSGTAASVALPKCIQCISLLPLQRQFQATAAAIQKGLPVNSAFSGKSIPPYVSALIHAGESSGSLGASMSRAAAVLDRDIEHSLRRLTSLIEPIMMAGMGTVVGSIALSIMLPIYDISKVLQK